MCTYLPYFKCILSLRYDTYLENWSSCITDQTSGLRGGEVAVQGQKSWNGSFKGTLWSLF